MAISDVIATMELPEAMRADFALYSGCIAGAIEVKKLKALLENSGFGNINIEIKEDSRNYIEKWVPGSNAEDYIASAYISAIRIK